MIEFTITVKVDDEGKELLNKYLISDKIFNLKLSSGKAREFLDKYPISSKALQMALDNVAGIYGTMSEGERTVWLKGFYNSFAGSLVENDRSNIGKLLTECNVKRGGNKNKPWINFDGFDYDKFKSMVSTYLQGKESE